MAHERAGSIALPEDLVDLAQLVTAYYSRTPDMSDPGQHVVFGTSGHRGSSLDTAFNEAHILATTQAIVEYRAAQGITGPMFIGRDTHALSEPAWTTALEVLAANDVSVLVDSGDRYTPTRFCATTRPDLRPRPTASSSHLHTIRRVTAVSSTTLRTVAPRTVTLRP